MILLSMNMYDNEHFAEIFRYTDKYPGLGVELFPLFHEPGYEEVLEKYHEKLEQLPISCHEQYYEAENSAEEKSEEFEKTDSCFNMTLASCRKLHSRYIVYHYNNKSIEGGKEKMLANARKRFEEVKRKAAEYGIMVVVENTGIPLYNNVLLQEEEFILECRRYDHKVLIDIGHAWCNHWNLSHVMEELQDRIVAYHIHNNDGIHDSHQRLHKGVGDFEQFLEDYKKYTPKADLVLEYVTNVREDVEGIQEDIEEMMQFIAK